MYLSISNFKNDWKEEHDATFTILNALSNESLTTPMPANVRSIATLAWHVVYSVSEMINHTDLKITPLQKEIPEGLTVSDLVSNYKKSSAEFISAIDAWEYNHLTIKIPMYGQEWTKGRLLQVIIQHQIHHRAQLTVLMRIANLKVPGVYGPSKDEWAGMGTQPEA
jgi:uncharacterized damage-inducible protein DinB